MLRFLRRSLRPWIVAKQYLHSRCSLKTAQNLWHDLSPISASLSFVAFPSPPPPSDASCLLSGHTSLTSHMGIWRKVRCKRLDHPGWLVIDLLKTLTCQVVDGVKLMLNWHLSRWCHAHITECDDVCMWCLSSPWCWLSPSAAGPDLVSCAPDVAMSRLEEFSMGPPWHQVCETCELSE